MTWELHSAKRLPGGRPVDGGSVWRWDRTAVMGIVNVTPDSFSDGGRFVDTIAAVDHAAAMVVDGAAIVDIGGESTRPGAEPVDPGVELARVLPVVSALSETGLPALISVDTRHAGVADAAITAGAHLVNDVSGLDDPAMAAVCARAGVPVVVVHHRGIPVVLGDEPEYDDVVGEVTSWLGDRIARARAAGVPSVVADPGIGFGKTEQHNLAVLAAMPLAVDAPVLVGASRKRFVGTITGAASAADRDVGSAIVHVEAARRGAAIVRVHDVVAQVHGLRMAAALDAASAAFAAGTGQRSR